MRIESAPTHLLATEQLASTNPFCDRLWPQLVLNNNMLAGLWADYFVEAGTYDATGIKKIASSLSTNTSLTACNLRFNLLVETEAKALQESVRGRAGFDLKI